MAEAEEEGMNLFNRRHLIEEEIELSLGLSLNGRFGVDPKKLKRSSSISDFLNPAGPAVGYPPLMRTCSLPVETEEECRKRKELQMLRRMEAKRKRTEKQRNSRVGGESNGVNFSAPPLLQQQGSGGSQGSGSSGVTESDSQLLQESKKGAEAKSPSSAESYEGAERSRSGMVWDVLSEMPCVTTKGEGPGGKRVQGFLYRYRKGEEVRIMCVCHGSFLTPAEFVKHGGGGEVEHPLRHIVVNPTPFL